MGVGILAKRVVLELGYSTNFVYSLIGMHFASLFHSGLRTGNLSGYPVRSVLNSQVQQRVLFHSAH